MNSKFHDFLNNVKTDENKAVIEAITQGYKCLCEGYADVRNYGDSVDAVTQFNRQVAYNSSIAGNDILAFLTRSGEEMQGLFTEDPNPELDRYTTTMYLSDNDDYTQEYDIDEESPYKELENELDYTRNNTGIRNSRNADDGIDESFGFSDGDIDSLV